MATKCNHQRYGNNNNNDNNNHIYNDDSNIAVHYSLFSCIYTCIRKAWNESFSGRFIYAFSCFIVMFVLGRVRNWWWNRDINNTNNKTYSWRQQLHVSFVYCIYIYNTAIKYAHWFLMVYILTIILLIFVVTISSKKYVRWFLNFFIFNKTRPDFTSL